MSAPLVDAVTLVPTADDSELARHTREGIHRIAA